VNECLPVENKSTPWNDTQLFFFGTTFCLAYFGLWSVTHSIRARYLFRWTMNVTSQGVIFKVYLSKTKVHHEMTHSIHNVCRTLSCLFEFLKYNNICSFTAILNESIAHSSCCMYFCRFWLLHGSIDMYSRRFPSGNLAKM
jgi:hypothetical protein